MLFVSKEISEDVFEKEFPIFLKNTKWDLIVKSIAKQYEVGVDEHEIIDFAKMATYQQLAMYGVNNPPDETITQYAMNSLKDEKSIRDIAAQVLEKKITKLVSENVDLNIQEISLDDFNKMISDAQNKEEALEKEQIGDVGETERIGEIGETEKIGETGEIEENKEVEEKE